MAGLIARLSRRRSLRWVFALCMAGFVYLAYVLLRPVPQFPPLPVPNGYEDLMGASNAIAGEPPNTLFTTEPSPAELKQVVEPNREPLRQARLGLSKACGVPVGFTRDDLDGRLKSIQVLRKLSRLLVAEGKLEECEGRCGAAIESYVDLYRLGRQTSAGGLMIDASLGMAFESLGSMGVSGIRAKLSKDEARRALSRLAEVDKNRENPIRVFTRERLWFRRAGGKWEQFMMSVTGVGEKLLRPAMESLQVADRRNQAYLRLLIVDLAVRAHHFETGQYPGKLNELVPGELTAVPIDPFSGHELVYKPTDAGYVLYSIGPDGRDDGGTPLPEKSNWQQATGDVVLNPPSGPATK